MKILKIMTTEKYKILAKYIKDLSSETPDIETFLFVKDNISKYQLNIDITSKAIKEKRHYEKASKDYINNHDLVVTTNTPFYNIVKSLPGGITSGISNDRKIARLISNIYADKIVSSLYIYNSI